MSDQQAISARSWPSVRGWLIGVSAVALIAVGWLTALHAALTVGLMLLAALVYAIGNAVWLRRALRRAGVQAIRRPNPPEPSWGTPTVITVIATGARLPLALIWRTDARVRDRVHPNVASYEGTVSLELSRSGWQASYRVTPLARGLWPLGPLKFRFTDVMGLITTRVIHREVTNLVVRPRVIHLEHTAPRSAGIASDRITERAIGSLLPDSDDALLREYVPGDDVRRVHWPTTARRSTLMVKNEESMPMTPITLILDGLLVPSTDISGTIRRPGQSATRDARVIAAHWSVDLAATLAANLAQHNTRVQLNLTASGQYEPAIESADILDTLTELPDLTKISDPARLVELVATAGEGLLLAIMAPALKDGRAQLARAGQDRRAGTSIAVIVSDESNQSEAALTQQALTEQGWRVIEARLPDADVAAIAQAVIQP
ncbi:Protein of unknown function DUF58 [Micrococcales bacterium KH10]|nr:Protein of unknown function DUF58 [Micrococcales bacterium KH10]